MPPIEIPFKRIYRPNLYRPIKFPYCTYLIDPKVCVNYRSNIFAYFLLQEDLKTIFQHIQPHNDNKEVFSHRIYELFLRACTEFESNAKAILIENGYAPQKQWTMDDYKKLELATSLSKYEIKLPLWKTDNGEKTITPFLAWKTLSPLNWYQDYNEVKHDRELKFSKANFENLITAIAAVLCILFAQFGEYATNSNGAICAWGSDTDKDGFDNYPDLIFSPKFFSSWSEDESYNFDQGSIQKMGYQNFNF